MAFDQPRASKAIAMVRAGEEAHLYSWCRDNSYITIGWFGKPPIDIGSWSSGQLEARFRAEYPFAGEQGAPAAYRNQGAQTRGLHNVADFLFNLPVGRKVMISSPDRGAMVTLGEVIGPYEFHADWNITTRFDPYCHYKPVRWIGEFARTELVEAASLPWTDQSTIWWVEDISAMRDLQAAAAGHPLGATGAVSTLPTAATPTSAIHHAMAAAPLSQLTPITDRDEIAAAYAVFVSQLTDGISPIRKGMGWRSGWSEFDAYWHVREQLWCVLEPEFAGTRYWCCFGPDDPGDTKDLSITCEINFAYEGVNRRIAGAFLKDDEGRAFVGHSGKIGGGHEGVGKDAFLKYLDASVRAEVVWPDGQTTTMLVLGMLDSPSFVSGLATFVSEVSAFKKAVREGTTDERVLSPVGSDDVDAELADYTPESLLGKASFEHRTRVVEMRLAHGPVVHALRDAIEAAGFVAKKNNRIDLAAVSGSGVVVTLFEVKTGCDWGSVYSAIGQLMYYGRTGAHDPGRLAAVLPPGGPADLDARFGTIGLHVVRYSYVDGKPVFTGLTEVLQ
jgi:hypothetical protein